MHRKRYTKSYLLFYIFLKLWCYTFSKTIIKNKSTMLPCK